MKSFSLENINAFVKSLRPENTLNLVLLFSIGYFFKIGTSTTSYISLDYYLGILILICTYSYAVLDNNIRDVDIDKVNNLKNRITVDAKTVTGITHRLIAKIFVLAPLCLSLFSFHQHFIFALLFIILSYLYNAYLFKRPVLSVLSLSFTYSLPLAYGYYIFHGLTYNFCLILVFILFFFLKVSIVILKDYRDIKGDALYNKRTFLIRCGHIYTSLISFILGSFCISFLFIFTLYVHKSMLLLPLLFIIGARLIYFRFKVLKNDKNILKNISIITYNQNIFDLLFLLCIIFY